MAREMKDSGIEWIGQVPDTWKVVKAKYIFENHKEIAGKNQNKYDRLSLTLKGVLKRSRDDTKGLQSESLETYQILRKGELVFKMIDLNNVSTSRVGYSPYEGLVSPVYIIFHNPKYSRFGYYYFFSMWQREIYNHLGNAGVRSSLNASDMLSLPFLLPPLSEQQKSADFLDEKVKEIDNAIEKTKKTIELYKKYKQAVITEAVTKGLNQNIEMKDSGVEWVKEIPNNWKTIKFPFAVQRITTGLNPRDNFKLNEDDATNYYVTIRNFKNGKLFLDSNCDKITDSSLNLIQKRSNLRVGDILFASISREGQAYLIKDDPKNWNINESVFSIRINKAFFNENYFYYLLINSKFFENLNAEATGSTFKSIKQEKLKQSIVIMPPIPEQQKIASFLDKKTKEIDNSIDALNRELKALEKYKKSLIYEYVTGKKEVS